jgi:hypothetical protein
MPEKLFPELSLPEGYKLMEDGAKRSRIEAKGYFKALMQVLPYRIILLLAWHEEFFTGNVVDDLRRLGQKVADYVSDERFVYYKDITLMTAGTE